MWVVFKKDGKLFEVEFSGKVNDAVEIDEVSSVGAASANEELHATYIASKAPDAKSKEEEVDV